MYYYGLLNCDEYATRTEAVNRGNWRWRSQGWKVSLHFSLSFSVNLKPLVHISLPFGWRSQGKDKNLQIVFRTLRPPRVCLCVPDSWRNAEIEGAGMEWGLLKGCWRSCFRVFQKMSGRSPLKDVPPAILPSGEWSEHRISNCKMIQFQVLRKS